MIANGERQVANRLEDIRADHRHRYEWAAQRLAGKRVVDAACGVGYGSAILADAGCEVLAFDRDEETIRYAKQNWNHRPGVTFGVADLYLVDSNERADAVVCFEALEHLVDPGTALRRFHSLGDTLLASVPNQVGFPYRGYKHHVRHYTPDEFRSLLEDNGWAVREWWGQEGPESGLEQDVLDGRTLVAVCERVAEPEVEQTDITALTPEEILGGPVPHSVAIVAMGNSRNVYFNETITGWGKKVADEVWAINAMAPLIQWDRMFQMDDLGIQQIRAEAGVTQMANLLEYMKNADKPIYTSRAYPDYPSVVEYPLEWVLNRVVPLTYFNSTVAYPIALAIACGVKEIRMYGADFTYPQSWKREKGRGCVEFWLGFAAAKGITISIPDASTLLDANQPAHMRLYGYDTEWVSVQDVAGRIKVSRVARLPEDVPTASEIELRYSKDPSKDSATPNKE